MNRSFIIGLFLLLCIAADAQQDTVFRQVSVLGSGIVNFTVDNLGNIYTLDKTDLLRKLDANGDSIAVFNEVRKYGKVYSIDATNPLKLLVYYKDFGTILILDRWLNVRNIVDLRKTGIYQARAIAPSFDNGIWVYDELEAKLKKINDDGSVVDQSADFRQVLELAPSPVQIIDQDKLVYLYDTLQGLLIFDYYGMLKNKVALTGWKDFQIIDHAVIGRKGALLERYEPGTLTLKDIRLDSSLITADRIKLTLNRLYAQKEGVLTIYER